MSTRAPNTSTAAEGVAGSDVKDAKGSTESSVITYVATANPHNKQNIELHQKRFRQDDTPNSLDRPLKEKQKIFEEMHASKDWEATHIPLKNSDMDVFKLTIDLSVQRIMHALQVRLVDQPYDEFGKTDGSWDGYTLMYRNGFPSGDHRKPVTDAFEEYWLSVYCPIMFTLIFGRDGYKSHAAPHIAQYKSCTIKVTESDTSFYDLPIFHMHIDGKIGMTQPKNHAQRHMSRMLFSIVTDTLDEDFDREKVTAREYGTTCYPIWQPKVGFRSNREFHKYMRTIYLDRGLENSGLPRPHYEIPEELIVRAVSGEVLWHNSHAAPGIPQAVHSEPNPCPDRHLFVFDFNNIIHKTDDGKFLPSTEIPMDDIIDSMRVLEEMGGRGLFVDRLREVAEVATELLSHAEKYPTGRAILDDVLSYINTVTATS